MVFDRHGEPDVMSLSDVPVPEPGDGEVLIRVGSDAEGVVRSTGSECKEGWKATSSLQAESPLAAEKRTLEMMAHGTSLSKVLNDLGAAIDAPHPLLGSYDRTNHLL